MGEPNIDYEKLQPFAKAGQKESSLYDERLWEEKCLICVSGLQAKETINNGRQ